jgi:metal-responsive CopG/Arc/MetJ family transcriptional regulator
MNMPIQTELPEALINKAEALIQAGWANNFNDLLSDALQRYLESHSDLLEESFILDDVK